MRAWTTLLVGLLAGTIQLVAQPLPDREDAAAVPLRDAMVLDPVGAWEPWTPVGDTHKSRAAGLTQADGHARVIVAEPDTHGVWTRRLAAPVDARIYPVLIITYRATGIGPGDEAVVGIGRRPLDCMGVLRARDLIADGQPHDFVVDLRDEADEKQPEFSAVALNVCCRGRGPACFELQDMRFVTDGDLPPLEAPVGDAVTVRVVDPAGKPIAGATVTAGGDWLNTPRATTDAMGKTTISVPDRPRQSDAVAILSSRPIRAAKPGMVTSEVAYPRYGALPTTLTLVPGRTYGGVVRNQKGEPIVDAAVTVHAGSAVPKSPRRWTSATVLTGRNGRWETPLLPVVEQSPRIAVFHPDYAPLEARDTSVAALRDKQAELVLPEGGRLAVQVVGPTGEPVPRASVARCADACQYPFQEMQTDTAGRAAFPGRFLGEVVLAIKADGLQPVILTLDVKPDQPETVIQLAAAVPLQGRIVDQGGQPVAGARVSADRWGQQARLAPLALVWSGTTDDQGRFVWDGAPQDKLEFTISKPGYMTQRHADMAPGEEEHRITLFPPLRITGTIRDAETKQPIKGARVIPGSHYQPQSRDAVWDRNRLVACSEGTYELTFASLEGSMAILAEADGYLPSSALQIMPGETERSIDLLLRPGRDIAGTVLLPDGEPAESALVAVVTREEYPQIRTGMLVRLPSLRMVETKEDGAYHLPAQEGKWLLVATHRLGYCEITATSYATSPDLRLQPWGRIEGTWQAGAQPVENRTVRAAVRPCWIDPDGSTDYAIVTHYLEGETDGMGRFTIEHVPSGKGTVSTSLLQGRHYVNGHSEPYDMQPGGLVHIELGGTGRPVVGQLRLPEGDETAVDWLGSDATLYTWTELPFAFPTPPDTWNALPLAQRLARFGEWRTTDEGRKFARQENKAFWARQHYVVSNPDPGKRYGLLIGEDGSIRADDIPAGRYRLVVELRAPLEEPRQSMGKSMGHFEFEVTVPEMPGGRSDTPLDLGELTITGIGSMF